MSWSILIAVLWVFAATGCAFLPIRKQYVPGILLLAAAPLLILWLGYDFGALVAGLAALGFMSMFRNPIIYIYRRMRGDKPELPR